MPSRFTADVRLSCFNLPGGARNVVFPSSSMRSKYCSRAGLPVALVSPSLDAKTVSARTDRPKTDCLSFNHGMVVRVATVLTQGKAITQPSVFLLVEVLITSLVLIINFQAVAC